MSESQTQSQDWEIDYQDISKGIQEADMNGAEQSEQSEQSGVQVKFEPEDPEYDQEGGVGSVSAGLLRSFPPPGMASSQSAAQWSGSSSAMRKIMENKSVDSSTAAQNVHNVIEDLLKKNEYLLAQNDAVGFKPNARRGRLPGEVGRSKEVVFPNPGQSTTFSVSHLTQGRITVSNSRNSPLRELSSVPMGQLMRPKSPTRRCSIPEKDRSHFNLALMESKVGCEEGEKIFRVQEHEMVCAISSQTKFLNKEGRLVSSMDINYYWCNFCTYSTTNKQQLMQHVIEHRFHCKHCRYQSFSRADVIHHSVHMHPGFQETASITQYCTLLSDYLRIHNPKEISLDSQREKRGPPDAENGMQPPSKMSKADNSKSKQKGFSADFELFDLNIEDLDENVEDENVVMGPQETGIKNSSSSSSFTAVQPVPDAPTNQLTGSNPACQTSLADTCSPLADSSHPVITQVFSASTIPPALAAETSSASTYQRSTASSSRGSSSRTSPSPSPTPLSQNSVGAGSMQQMRTNLYWSCGYCTFTSKSQSGIKDHSRGQHSGKPHRYVVLVKPEESSTPPPSSKSGSGEDSNSSADQNLEVDVAEENRLVDSQDVASEDSAADNSQLEEPPVLVKMEPVEQDPLMVPIKVRFPTPRIQPKDNTSLKCYHCNYASRILGPLRNHILTRHKGKCLVGLGGMNSKVFMCTRSDCTFRSSSGQTFLHHSQDCTPWLQPDATDVPSEPHLLECLKATAHIAEEAQALSPPAFSASSSKVSYEYELKKFSCIYCKKLFSSGKEQTKQHVMKYHGSQCLIIRDIQTHRNRKRSSVFFCRWCPWEGEHKAEYDLHKLFCQQAKDTIHCKEGSTHSSSGDFKEKGEDSGTSFNVVSADDLNEDHCDVDPPDITSNQDHFSNMHDTLLTPNVNAAECAPFVNKVVSPFSGEKCPQLIAADDDEMPELVEIEAVDPTANVNAPALLNSGHPLVPLTRLKEILDRGIEYRKLSSKKQVKGTGKKGQIEYKKLYCCKGLLKAKAKKDHKQHSMLLSHKTASLVKRQTLNQGFHNKSKSKRPSFGKSMRIEGKAVTEVQCFKCPFHSDSLNKLKSHMKTSHDQHVSFSFRSLYHSGLHLKCKFYACPMKDCCVYRYNEADIVQHYRQHHSFQPHPYLSSSYLPAPVKFCQTQRSNMTHPPKKSILEYSQNPEALVFHRGSKVTLNNKRPYLCLYCDQYFYAGSVSEMKAHHLSVHPGQAIVFRDIMAFKYRKASRISVCDQPQCDFRTYLAEELNDHKCISHSGSHVADQSFQCTSCGWISTKYAFVYEHVTTVHASEGGATVVTFTHSGDQHTVEEQYISI